MAQRALALLFRLVLVIWVIAVVFGLFHSGQAMCDAPRPSVPIPIGIAHATADWLLSRPDVTTRVVISA